MQCNFDSCTSPGRFRHYFEHTKVYCMRHRTDTMIDICTILLLEQTNDQTMISPVTQKRSIPTPWAPRKVRRTTNDALHPDMIIYDDIAVGNFQPYDWKTLARNVPLLAYLNGAQK